MTSQKTPFASPRFRGHRAFILLLALVLAPAAQANHLDERDVSAVHLVSLVYHPHPDPKGDPYGVPYVEGNRSGDWMSVRYDAYWFPTAAFDGVTVIEQTPPGEGGGPFLETYATYKRAYEDRSKTDTPFTLRIEGRIESDSLTANVTATPSLELSESGLVVRAAIFEDDIEYDGGNGVANHRFVVQAVPQTQPLNLQGVGPISMSFAFPRDETWRVGRLGIAAWVQNEDELSRQFKEREILQAAVWTTEQTGPTVQAHKAVLVELYSATWCEACPPGDAAVDELSNTLGLSSIRLRSEGWAYVRPGAVWSLPAAVGLGLLVAAALRPRVLGEAKP